MKSRVYHGILTLPAWRIGQRRGATRAPTGFRGGDTRRYRFFCWPGSGYRWFEPPRNKSDKPRVWAEPSATTENCMPFDNTSKLHHFNSVSCCKPSANSIQFAKAFRIITETFCPLARIILRIEHRRIMEISTVFQ